jgi:CO dehydrogenase maturation factor
MGALSREFLNKITLNEDEMVIVDMEAGVEHFGRGVETSIDNIIIVVEPSFESLELAERIKGLAEGIKRNFWAVLNKIDSEGLASRLTSEVKGRGIDVIGVIPKDPVIFEACLEGHAPGNGEATHAAGKILDFLLAKP